MFLIFTGFTVKTSDNPKDSNVRLVSPTTRTADIGNSSVFILNAAVKAQLK